MGSVNSLPSKKTRDPDALRIWQEQLLDWLLWSLFIFWVAMLGWGLFAVRGEWKERFDFHTSSALYITTAAGVFIAIILFVIALIFRKRIGYTFRALGMLGIVYLLGSINLILSGLSGDGRVFLLAFIILSAVFLPPRQSVLALGVSILTICFAAWLLISRTILIPPTQLFDLTQPATWTGATLVFATLGVALAISISRLVVKFQKNLSEAEHERQFVSAILDTMGAMMAIFNSRGEILNCNQACLDVSGFTSEEFARQKTWETILPLEDLNNIREIFRQIRDGKNTREYEGKLIAKNGEIRQINWRFSAVNGGTEAENFIIATGVDFTERRRAEKAVRRQYEELAVLQAVSTAGTMATGEDALIENATQILANALFPDNFGVLILDEETGLLHIHKSYHSSLPPGTEIVPVPIGSGVTGTVAITGMPLYIPDTAHDSVYLDYDHLTRSEMCVPLKIGNRVIGVLNAESKKLNNYTPADEQLMTTIAGQLSVAIENVRLYAKNEEAYLETIIALAETIGARDHYTSDHSKHLAYLAEKTAQKMGLPREDQETIRWAGLLHDIGKIGVSDEILRKPGPLSSDEMSVIHQHPTIGANIVAPVKSLTRVAPLIRAHQEKFDGSGYPEGLSGKSIPLGARIISVVDAYSAMTDERVYRRAISPGEAVAELCRCAGTHFDPEIVDAFLQILEKETGQVFNFFKICAV